MAFERRLYARAAVNWKADITFTEGPPLAARVVDFSPAGASLEIPAATEPARMEVLEMQARKRRLWGLAPAAPLSAVGRVVHIQPSEADGLVRVGVRFHTPLRQPRPRASLDLGRAIWRSPLLAAVALLGRLPYAGL